jgi:putative ABC transport system ATP-binding protein
MPFISAKGLTKVYGQGETAVSALKGVSLTLERGDFMGVMGESGAGKSTLLALLGALDQPSEGSLLVDELDIFSLTGEKQADFRNEYLGFVFQSFQLISYLTAQENVMLPLSINPLKNREKRAMARYALEKVGLGDKVERLPHQLSGGEQERTAIARAIVNDPPVLLADEPTGNLDSDNGKRVMDLLAGLNQEGQTIIMVTHNPDYGRYAGKRLFLKDGRIIGPDEGRRKH